ncbi:MAG: branched-chain amino acid ABC transporter permease, partial [Acidimicrobiales bacterium]
MSEHLVFLLLGLGAGAVYAALGLGLVLTYRSTGVVNLAHGALAMYATYAFTELRDAAGLGSAASMVVAVGGAGLLGVAVYALVFRPLREAPPVVGLVASVGLTVALQALAVLQFGTANRSVPALLPARPLGWGDVSVASDRVLLAALVTAAAAALWAVGRFSRVGLAARAASQSESGAMAMGWSPDALAAGSWALAGGLGALGGILVGPITQLNPDTYSLLIVPALAAASVARLSSFGVTVAVGLAIGMAQSEIVLLQDRFSALPRVGLGAGLPLVVIVFTQAL